MLGGTGCGCDLAVVTMSSRSHNRVLRPLLSEANGDQIVEELALEHALRRELRARGITIGEAQIESARESWLTLLEESGVSARAETEIRRRRGLGPERFERLLWRNAALRALLDPAEIEVTDTEVGLARTIRTGRRYMVTGVITRDSASALAIGERVRSSAAVGKAAAAALWEAADERALVPFRSVISPLDPAFPEAIRRSLPGLRVGEAGPVVAVDNGYASIVVDGVVEPTNDASGSAPDDASLRRELRIRKTRVAMERLARTLIDRTEVTRLDGTRP